MTKYVLSGFASLGIGKSSFLIPYFVSTGSNEIYVQDLDDSYIIARFLRFELTHYSAVQYFPPYIVKEVGDAGLLAFMDSNSSVYHGSKDELQENLHNSSLAADQNNFFKIDAFSFLNHQQGLQASITDAKNSISNAAIGEQWASGEILAARKYYQRQEEGRKFKDAKQSRLSEGIERLLNDPNSSIWYRLWKSLWDLYPQHPRLLELAYWWIQRSPKERSGVPQVIMWIIDTDPDQKTAWELGRAWLRDVEVHRDPSMRLWLSLTWPGFYDLELLEIGIRLLQQAAARSEFDRRAWARVWRRVQGNLGENVELAELAELAYDPRNPNVDLIKKVLIEIVKWKTRPAWATYSLLKWLESATKVNNTWVDAYLTLLPERFKHEEFINLGLRWLEHGPPNLRKWKKLWTALSAPVANDDLMFHLARGWLHRANPEMYAWRDVMLILLRSKQYTIDELELADEWLLTRDPNQLDAIDREIISLMPLVKPPPDGADNDN